MPILVDWEVVGEIIVWCPWFEMVGGLRKKMQGHISGVQSL